MLKIENNENGYSIKLISQERDYYGREVTLVTKFTDYVYDEQGNWVKRSQEQDKKILVTQRIIKYY